MSTSLPTSFGSSLNPTFPNSNGFVAMSWRSSARREASEQSSDDAMTDASTSLVEHQARSRAWFESLRDDLCAAFERLEADLPAGAPFADQPPGRVVRTPWTRAEHG